MIPQPENPSEGCQHLNIDSDLARSSMPTLPTDIDSYYEAQDSELAASGDPLWVARPRNAFIIFRCEYAQRHSRMGRRARRTDAPAEKSLSKRAAEAWHQLSNEEKRYFKTLADQERIEHARLYPYYRFRPVKRSSFKRSPHPRVVSVTNLLEQCSDQEVEREAIPNLITRGISVHDLPDSPCSPSSSFDFVPDVKMSHPLDVRCQQGSAGHLTQLPATPSIPWLSQPGSIHVGLSVFNMKPKLTRESQPLLTQSDLNSAKAVDFFYLENTLPPIPQYCGYVNFEADHASLRSSSLANWDGKAIDNTAPCRLASTPAYIRPEDTCDNINIGMGYDGLFGYTASQDDGASVTIPCLPIQSDLHIVEARRITVPAYPRPTLHEVGGRVEALLYHYY